MATALTRFRSCLTSGAITLGIAGVPASERLHAQQGACSVTETARVNPTLANAAGGSVAGFAKALALSELCAGIVSVRHDVEHSGRLGDANGAGARSLEGVLATFASRKGFASRLVDGFVLLTDGMPTPNTGPLARIVPAFDVDSVSAIDVLQKVVIQLSPELARFGGRVGSVLGAVGAPSPAEEEVYGPLLRMQIARAPLLDVLVQVGRASPGVVWVVSADPASSEAVIIRAYTKGGITHTLGQVRPE